MAERIFLIKQPFGWDWREDVLTSEYCAPRGLNEEWIPTGRNIVGSVVGIPHSIVSSLGSKDMCVFGFEPEVSDELKERFREGLADAFRQARARKNA